MPDTKPTETNAGRDGERRASTAAKFWIACPSRRCRRARACIGDAADDLPCCVALAGEDRAWFAAICRAFGSGGSEAQVVAAGAAAVERYRRVEEIGGLLRDAASLVRRTARQRRLARSGT